VWILGSRSLSENYQYDADNNLTSKTDRKGQTITYLYDALNRLTSKTYPDTRSPPEFRHHSMVC
jgi:YD repeat-containing protein